MSGPSVQPADGFAKAWPVRFALPGTLQIRFPGFAEPAFSILERLRREPHLECYTREKAGIQREILAPFKDYRDDLVVNGLLPHGIDLETERNVFSRILKNDFGAGGAHHHLWMAFYRRGRTRLKDIQLLHSLHPDRFTVGLYASRRMGSAWKAAKQAIGDGGRLERVLSGLTAAGFDHRLLKGASEERTTLQETPASKLSGLWVSRSVPRDRVISLGPDLAGWGLEQAAGLWPLYRALVLGGWD